MVKVWGRKTVDLIEAATPDSSIYHTHPVLVVAKAMAPALHASPDGQKRSWGLFFFIPLLLHSGNGPGRRVGYFQGGGGVMEARMCRSRVLKVKSAVGKQG